ncbi:polygalacturonase precursor [Sphaerosporella brunnea]|uniref:endo-polygalacturonase n=1 Tax=Sphaerosporella brunnea TaxID=1250544 RepID=A0A5J5EYF8_9PEZI|nr:polygalacturonase precursor [Sphaerosporella brunnea]
MRFTTAILVAVLEFTAVLAAPTDLEKRASCTVTSYSALSAAKSSCSTITIGNLAVPAGKTLDLTGLSSGTKVIFSGEVTFGYEEWEGPLVSVSGTKITVTGTSGNLLNGGGASWWDGKGSNGGKTKPKFFAAHKMINSSITGLKIKNTPVQCFSINNSQNLDIESVTIDNRAGDVTNGGHNTDAFDIGSSTGITINKATVYNQDDCLAINSGSDIVFSNGYCSGGHGLSIGSVGGRSDNVVKGVTISDTTVVNSQNGARIKTVYGATGSVSDITYSGITLQNISQYGIVIEQDYQNGSPTGTPTKGVPISGVTMKNVKGTVTSSGTEVYILCASCSNFTWSGVSVTGGKKSSKCKGIPSGASC